MECVILYVGQLLEVKPSFGYCWLAGDGAPTAVKQNIKKKKVNSDTIWQLAK